MSDRATNLMLQQLYQQQHQQQQHQQHQQHQQQRRHHSHHHNSHQQNGVSRGGSNGASNMFDTQTSNGTSIQFSSSTGNGGTWQRNSNTPSSINNNSGVGSGGYNMNGYSMMGGIQSGGSNGLIAFRCCECSITKNSCEELEIHIKTEHLNWMPFRCLKCHAVRASDTQIREHMFSAHKNEKGISLNHYSYIDNQSAKRELLAMLDRALLDAASSIALKRSANSSHSRAPPNKRLRGSDDESLNNQPLASATITVLPKSNTSDILAQIQAARSDDDDPMDNGLASVTEGNAGSNDEQTPELDEFTSSQLSRFGTNPLDPYESYNQNDSSSYIDQNDSSRIIENLNALLGNPNLQPENSYTAPNGKLIKTRAPRGSRQVNCVSKKRVLGECSRCQKPVTAGARQMHMFYHLGKDYNTYRFKCKFDDCEVEHYRKDQMENHQSKQHGRIDPDMMEDRSIELADMVQELSMELLGTVGNTPGPTAEKAQMMYNTMQKEQAEAATKKKKRFGFAPSDYGSNGSLLHTSPSTSSMPSPRSNGGLLKLGGDIDPSFVKPETKRNEEYIKCLMCDKTMMMRVRGFHLLWHLNNDLGIIRYNCKYCTFKHERAQSVSTHGRREHNSDDCVEDSLGKYEEEVKSMSKACFGIEQLFADRTSRGKTNSDAKMEDNNILLFDEDFEDPELDENGESHSELSEGAAAMKASPMKDPLLGFGDGMKNSSTPKGSNGTTTPSSTAKKRSMRRFGTRRPKSKKQKLEMAKLRELSLILGGAQYFRKRINDTACCEKCGKPTQSRLSHHAYSHLDIHLFQCPECQLGNPSRDQVVKHLKDFHNSTKAPIDNRLKYAQEIKDAIRECYPDYFIDAPIPTAASVEKLKGSADLTDSILGGDEHEIENEIDNENDENASDAEEHGENGDDEEGEIEADQHTESAEHEPEDEEDIPKLFPNDTIDEDEEVMEESNDAPISSVASTEVAE